MARIDTRFKMPFSSVKLGASVASSSVSTPSGGNRVQMSVTEPTAAQLKPFFNQLHELTKGVLSGRLRLDVVKSALKNIIDSRKELRFWLLVNYNESVEQRIAAADYSFVNPDITSGNFSREREGLAKLDVELMSFDVAVNGFEAMAVMKTMQVRPATMAELLSFGISFPNFQCEFPIAALGSAAVSYPKERRLVGVLSGSSSQRFLSLVDIDEVWFPVNRFLVVHAESEHI